MLEGHLQREETSQRLTFTLTQEQDVNFSKNTHSLVDSGLDGTDATITGDATNAVLPSFTVLPPAITLRDKFRVLCFALFVSELEWRQTGDHIVAVRQQLSREPNS